MSKKQRSIQCDRGFQYTSNAYKALAAKAEMIVSMSCVGYCIGWSPFLES